MCHVGERWGEQGGKERGRRQYENEWPMLPFSLVYFLAAHSHLTGTNTCQQFLLQISITGHLDDSALPHTVESGQKSCVNNVSHYQRWTHVKALNPKTIQFSITVILRWQHKLLTEQLALSCWMLFGAKFRSQIGIMFSSGCKRLIIFMRTSSGGEKGSQLNHMLSLPHRS